MRKAVRVLVPDSDVPPDDVFVTIHHPFAGQPARRWTRIHRPDPPSEREFHVAARCRDRIDVRPPDIELRRYYRVPAGYDTYHLHQLFDQPAAAGGWRREFDVLSGIYGQVSYCKQIGPQRVAFAGAYSESDAVVLVVRAADCGTECYWMRPRSDTQQNCS